MTRLASNIGLAYPRFAKRNHPHGIVRRDWFAVHVVMSSAVIKNDGEMWISQADIRGQPRFTERGAARVFALAGAALVVAFAFALSACRTAPVTTIDWPAEKKARQELSVWELAGRAAVATADNGWSAGIRWSQEGAASELNLSGALGIGGVRVRSDGQAFTIDTSKGEHIEAPDASEALARTLGVELPVHNLRFWLLGVPAPQTPAVESFDAQGRLQQLEQDGWTGTFDRYVLQGGRWLPGRVQMRQGDGRIRVVISRWQLQ